MTAMPVSPLADEPDRSAYQWRAWSFDRTVRHRFLAMIAGGIPVSQAARACNVSRGHVYRRLHTDPYFAEQFHEAEMEAHETVEGALFMAAASGNVPAIKFYLANKMPGRWADGSHVPAPSNTLVNLTQNNTVNNEVYVIPETTGELRERAFELLGKVRRRELALQDPLAIIEVEGTEA